MEAQKEVVYTADYDSTIRKYAVVFLGVNKDTLAKDSLYYGTMPTPPGEIPAKESTKLYDYTPVWKPALAEVSGNATYMASYDSTKRVYTIILNDYDGKEIDTFKNSYDFEITLRPSREATENNTYEFNEWKLDESKIEKDTLIYTAEYINFVTKKNGAIRYAYKVSDTTRVYFSQGNLQFNAIMDTHKTADSTAQGTWRFAENQYDCIRDDNFHISPTSFDWIDLFGFGTSGWNSGANAYEPWSTSTADSDYCPNSLTGDYANADWGVYNAISNGGDEPNQWRTLTTDEWLYLFKNNKWTLGCIKDKNNPCFMLIPADFKAPEGITMDVLGTGNLSDEALEYMSDVSSSSYMESSCYSNTYTLEQFSQIEKLGVVAMPCGKRRLGNVFPEGIIGGYWSSSASLAMFCPEYLMLFGNGSRSDGWAVRLVQDAQ